MAEKEQEVKVEGENLEAVFGAKKKRKKEKKAPTEGQEKPEVNEETPSVQQTKEEDEKNKESNSNIDLNEAPVEISTPMDTKEARTKALSDFPSFVERDYTYEELVARLFGMIQKPEEKTTVKIKPPIVYKEGTTRTAWANFPQICASINRQPEHVLQFVLAEVASTGSVDGNGRLLIRGRFQQKHMEKILRHYIVEYVQCHTCKSLETKLHKENRLLFMKCDTCCSTRSVAQIKTGFQATTRASRRTQQNSKT